ncbi:MAG: methylhydantoinase [Woeseia sp.]|nr:methylhydantoinase [Woeseia sp.]|tara:strand:- start:182 stop:1975 length:1794 start_codon:yes stop_codon:yes gene_type:complete
MTRTIKQTQRGVRQLDPVTFEVLRSQLDFCCDRMSKVLYKTAFSPILSDILDFSNAVYDADIRLLAQSPGCPIHMAAMHFAAQESIKEYGRDKLRHGDVIVLNDPFAGGTHIPDITFTMPIFVKDELLGFAVSRGHWQDLGGGAAGGQSFGTHIAGEGLRIPPMRIFNEGVLNNELFRLIRNNTRCPQYIEGDIQAHLGALKVAEQELGRAVERYGIDTVRTAMRELIAYTNRITRQRIDALPDGEYEVEDIVDTDGFSTVPIKLMIKVIINGEELTVDFTGSDSQCVGAINSPLANTYSAVYLALRFFLCPEAPANAGLFEAIKIILPDDCWLNAKWPAPTIGCTTVTAAKINSAIWMAMGQADRTNAIGGTMSDCNWLVCAVTDPQTNEQSIFSDLPAGGWGGMRDHDGVNVNYDPTGNCMNLSAEVAELCYPVTYEAFEIRCDSGGAGLSRGGLGAKLQIRFKGHAELSIETSRTIEGSPGLEGGERSSVQTLYKTTTDGEREVIGGWKSHNEWLNPLLSAYRFNGGEAFSIETTGGGGLGDPFLRLPEKVLEDVLDDYVSIKAARERYGVIIDPLKLDIDRVATDRFRAQRAE